MTLEALTQCLEREFKHWEHLYTYGGYDPFYADGMNLNLVRNHILSYKREIERFMEKEEQELTLFASSYPDIYYKETPPEVSYDYMARADEIRARAHQQLALYQQDPNFCYIRDHHREVFPIGTATRATNAANLYPSASGQTLWYSKYIEQDSLVDLRRVFYEPYEKKAVRWAELAEKMKAFLSHEHSPEDNTPVHDTYYDDEEEYSEEPCEVKDEPVRKPSLSEQIQQASSRAGKQTNSTPAREEQISLF